MLDELDTPAVAKPPAPRAEHDVREVEAHAAQRRTIAEQEGEQSAIPRPQVKEPPSVTRHQLGQDALALRAVGHGVGQRQVVACMPGVCPFLTSQTAIVPQNKHDDAERRPRACAT